MQILSNITSFMQFLWKQKFGRKSTNRIELKSVGNKVDKFLWRQQEVVSHTYTYQQVENNVYWPNFFNKIPEKV